MPNKSNAVGSLEIQSDEIPSNFALQLNDRFRRIEAGLLQTQAAISTATTSSSGGAAVNQVILTVPGTLAIQSNAAAALTLPATRNFTTAILLLKQPPQAGSVTVQPYVAGVAWGPVLTIGSTAASVNLSGAIAKDALIRLDITGVGLTFPGSDLTVELR